MASSWVGHALIGRRMSNQWKFSTPVQVGLVDVRALGQLLRAAVGHLANEQLLDTVEGVGFHDAQLVVQVQAEALEFIVDDLTGRACRAGCLRG